MIERSIFFAALEIDDPAARRLYLDEACQADAALRERVDALLAAHEEVRTFMDRSPAATPFDLTNTDLTNAAALGPIGGMTGTLLADRYRLGEEIGRGGMGTVYRADQLRPVCREVAIKLVNPGMDSRSVLTRFEAERQALAMMDHPQIAKVLDAGATADGRPFFVMELVRGVPLTDYCDAHHLPMVERLDLLRQVCGAVQHAHQKGVIHRDLKPSNILVEERDGAPVPKVIDFGLAKAVGGAPLTDQTLFTAPGSVAGTPLYMAPEQAGPDGRDVDTRADVYALGAVLYELLTGSPPIGRETLRRAALHEVFRVLREDDPQPPSSRLGSSADLPTVAVNRRTEPARLGRLVRGDLDWVAMKALEKDRGRRYESAAALGQDLARFLNHEPVVAGPPTLRYRASKFVRRHRAAVTAATLVLLALIGGFVGTTLGLIEARHQQNIADAARRAEKSERTKAETNLAYARKGNQLLGSVFAGLDPTKIADSGRPLQDLLKENLRTAVQDLDESAVGDALAVAEMRAVLATSLLGLGDYALAVNLFEKVVAVRTAQLGPSDPATLLSQNDLATSYLATGRPADAVALWEQTLKEETAHLGPEHLQTLTTMNNLANGYKEAGRTGDAVVLWERSLKLLQAKLGSDDPKTLRCMSGLAYGYYALGRMPDAVALWEQSLKLTKARLGVDHPDTLSCMSNLAGGYQALGRLNEATSLMEESLRLTRARLGPAHPFALIDANNLAFIYNARGESERAATLHEDVLRLMRSQFGPDHPTTLDCLANLCNDLAVLGRFDRAIPLLEEHAALRRSKLGPGHPDSLAAANHVAEAYRDAGRLDQAIPLFEQVIRDMEKYQGQNATPTRIAKGGLGITRLRAGQLDSALPLLEEGYRADRSDPSVRTIGPPLVDAYIRSGKQAEATRLILEITAEERQRLPAGSLELASRWSQLGKSLLLSKAYTEAESLLRECLAFRDKAEPDAWTTSNARSLLGGALLGRRQFAEAEPLLKRAYEELKQREPTIPPAARECLPETLDRLIELSEALNRPEDARKWQAERNKYPPPRNLYFLWECYMSCGQAEQPVDGGLNLLRSHPGA